MKNVPTLNKNIMQLYFDKIYYKMTFKNFVKNIQVTT